MNETLEEPGIDTGRHHLSEFWKNRPTDIAGSLRKTKSAYAPTLGFKAWQAGNTVLYQHCINLLSSVSEEDKVCDP